MGETLAIWKYPLVACDWQEIEVPKPARCVSVINQRGTPTLYCLVDPDAVKQVVTIRILGTGHPIHPFEGKGRLQFLGTVNCEPFVWHIFWTH